MIARIKKIITFLWYANVWKTVFVNFRLLPLKEAFRLPIHLFGRVCINECIGGGKIVLSSQRKPHFGAWKVGDMLDQTNGVGIQPHITRLAIHGTLVLGEYGWISNGCSIYVASNAYLSLEKDVFLNACVKICCEKAITIGSQTRISWESQIIDTDFHYFVSDQKIKNCQKKIVIGKNVWIGNRVTLNKGSEIADWSIIASGSLVNRNFSNQSHVLLAGMPAKIIKSNVSRIFSFRQQAQLNEWFRQHSEAELCIDEHTNIEYV